MQIPEEQSADRVTAVIGLLSFVGMVGLAVIQALGK
jgi:hypothetical protein